MTYLHTEQTTGRSCLHIVVNRLSIDHAILRGRNVSRRGHRALSSCLEVLGILRTFFFIFAPSSSRCLISVVVHIKMFVQVDMLWPCREYGYLYFRGRYYHALYKFFSGKQWWYQSKNERSQVHISYSRV